MEKINGNKDSEGNLILFKEHFCNFCGEEGKFMNIGQEKDFWICNNCKCKTDFGKRRLVINQFGYYFIENNKNSLELREKIMEKIKTDGYLYSEFRKWLNGKNLDIEIVFREISYPEKLINLYREFKKSEIE